jgi:primosomal protein N' (replication factor Y) (superfamily II helicase)
MRTAGHGPPNESVPGRPHSRDLWYDGMVAEAEAARVQAAPNNPPQKRRQRAKRPKVAADRDPVARIAVDVPLPHLDRPFDYLVPDRLDEQARPGARVRVRFSGQLVDGYLTERRATSDHTGRLSYLDRVVSPEPVLTEHMLALARAVADRYAGTLADVLRLAIPPRHAGAEAEPGRQTGPTPGRPEPGTWARYPEGEAFLDALSEGKPARAAWQSLPGPHWPDEIARAAATAAAAGRGVLIVVPDGRDLARVVSALAGHRTDHVALSADLGPAERYRRWLAVSRGAVRVAAGTRAAMFAPVRDLGLVVLWDDGDDLHAEPRAPYPHAREVLALRAHRDGAAALIGGFARTPEMQQLVANDWARDLRPGSIRQAAPLVRPSVDEAELARDAAAVTARLPSLALRTARKALAEGPVLVQVPRRGYLAAIACANCRAPARCPRCGGPLQVRAAREVPDCRWCGALASDRTCPRCGHTGIRAIVTGAARTAEELGRAFPSVKVRTSGGQAVLASVPDEPALVIATPGAEPVADYAGALLLDGWALLGRPSLRAEEETLRRWLAAAALVRPSGTVLVHADAQIPAVQALIRWDPVHFAERELAGRSELRFPPTVRMASVTGSSDAVASLLAGLPQGAEILGPVPVDDDDGQVRALVRAPRTAGLALARAMRAAQAARTARKEPGTLRIQLDPEL